VQDPQICNWRVMCNVVYVMYNAIGSSYAWMKSLTCKVAATCVYALPYSHSTKSLISNFFRFTGVFVAYCCCFFHLFTPIDCNCQMAVVSEGCSYAYMQICDLVAHWDCFSLLLIWFSVSSIPWQSAALVVESETSA